jgi:hypothetical protein
MFAPVAGEVAVVAVDHGQAGAHVTGEIERGDAGTEGEGCERVPEIVDPAQWLDAGDNLGPVASGTAGSGGCRGSLWVPIIRCGTVSRLPVSVVSGRTAVRSRPVIAARARSRRLGTRVSKGACSIGTTPRADTRG